MIRSFCPWRGRIPGKAMRKSPEEFKLEILVAARIPEARAKTLLSRSLQEADF